MSWNSPWFLACVTQGNSSTDGAWEQGGRLAWVEKGQALRFGLEFDLGGDGTGDLWDTQQRHLPGTQVGVNV